jgi:23S rRNA (cytosine1962-C5)-methyltransferase
LNAAAGGAASVDAVDISESAVDYVKQNSLLNHMKVNALRADVFDYLKDLDESKKHPYELIILDPPAFTKSGATVRSAFRGYKEINYRAMKILPRGGYLATCSCSHFMDDDLFRKMLKEAARDAGVSLRQIEFRQQSPDHPIVMTIPETSYLKFFLLQVV